MKRGHLGMSTKTLNTNWSHDFTHLEGITPDCPILSPEYLMKVSVEKRYKGSINSHDM